LTYYLGLLSIPTRRSSDLDERFPRGLDDVGADADRPPRRLSLGVHRLDEHARHGVRAVLGVHDADLEVDELEALDLGVARREGLDRKSTRLNSSHVKISYA